CGANSPAWLSPGALTVFLRGTEIGVGQVVSPGANPSRRSYAVRVPKPPPRCATSWMLLPTITGPEAVVVNVGVALLTVELSLASLQAVSTAFLLPSPEEWRIQR